MQMTVLYLCYQSLHDPLTQTQVVAYLEGLARDGFRIVLLTFESPSPTADEQTRIRKELNAKGITWRWMKYHKRPTLPATAWDILRGIVVGLWLICRHGVRLVHARSHVPGVIAACLQSITGVKFLFDIRGLMAEEYADAGVWRAGGRLFRWTKYVERRLVKKVDGIVVLTERAKEYFQGTYHQELRNKPIEVIPCCVDFRKFPDLEPNEQLSVADNNSPTVVYIGKLGGWYLTEEMVAFVAAVAEVYPELRWQVWTQSDHSELLAQARKANLADKLTIGRLPPDAVARELRRTQAGLAFIKPCFSKIASSATKVAEYLAAGLPVVATSGIGDTDAILSGAANESRPVGVLVADFSTKTQREAAMQLRELLRDPGTPARCRAAAEQHFHLERVGWVRYRRLYRRLIGGGN